MDLVTHNGVLIVAAPAKIWPYIVDPNAWKTGATLLSMGGKPGGIGERFSAVATADPEKVLFIVENVEIVTERRRTIRLEDTDGTLIGFAAWQLISRNDSTLVQYDVYCQLTSNLMEPSWNGPLAAEAEHREASYRRFAEELDSLKKLVEEHT
jgi:hypothetical protein